MKDDQVAHRIEYLNGFDANYMWYSGYPGSWSAEDAPDPEDVNRIYHIRLDNAFTTENVAALNEEEAVYRWELLTDNMEMDFPGKWSAQSAAAHAEAIWLDTLAYIVKNEEMAYNLRSVLRDMTLVHLHEEDLDEYITSWPSIKCAAENAGVLHRMEAWAAGSPLEVLLAE